MPGCAPQVTNLLEHLNDSPSAVPRRQLARLLYGRDSVFARVPTPAQIAALTRADAAAHLAAWQRPDLAVLGVAGEACTCTASAEGLQAQPAVRMVHLS